MPWAAGCCIGLGLFLTQANVFFKDTRTVTTALLYLTPIFCPLEALPEMAIWVIRHCDPMYFYVGRFRDPVHYGQCRGI